MQTVLAVGGSNVIGRGPGGPAMDTASSRVTVWNNTNDLGANGTAWIAPPAAGNAPWDTSGALGNSAPLWFCDRLAREHLTDVRLVVVGNNSASMEDFTSPGTMWTELLAVWAAAAPSPADVFISGITVTASEAGYNAAFLAFVAALRSNGLLAADAPVIINGAISVDDAFLEAVATNNAGYYFAPVDTLIGTGDGVHFSGPSLYQFGSQIQWAAYHRHVGPVKLPGRFVP